MPTLLPRVWSAMYGSMGLPCARMYVCPEVVTSTTCVDGYSCAMADAVAALLVLTDVSDVDNVTMPADAVDATGRLVYVFARSWPLTSRVLVGFEVPIPTSPAPVNRTSSLDVVVLEPAKNMWLAVIEST